MPITFYTTPDGLLHAKQSFDSPTVYLDHWAMRTFSDDLAIQDRFVHALLSKQGTLLISQYSVSEFSKASRDNCLAAEQFVDRILPNVFLTDVNVDKLVAQEISAPNNEIRFWPPADLPQLKALATRAVVTQSPLSTASYFTTAFDHRTELLSLAATLYSELCEAITDMCTK